MRKHDPRAGQTRTAASQKPPQDPHPNPWIEQRRRTARWAEELRQREILKALAARNLKDPVKVRARKMVRAAVRRGDLRQLPCNWKRRGEAACGKLPTEAHHASYDRGQELNVRWLCKEHHDVLTKWEFGKRSREMAAERNSSKPARIEAPGVVVLED